MLKEIVEQDNVNEDKFTDMYGMSKDGYEAMTKGKDKKALGMLAMSILSDAQENIKDRKTEQYLNIVKYLIDTELR